MKLRQKLTEFISLDYRSLALMRLSVGVVIILDLFDRARSLTAHYTDAGVLSRTSMLADGVNRFFISLHMASGLYWVEIGIGVIAGIAAAMLILGYRTRLAVIVSWLLLISLHARNPLVLQGGDVVLRVVLFWMMFLPIGRRWSIDRLQNRVSKALKSTVASPATFAYILQIVLIYVMSGVLKTGAAWHDGTAVYYALSVDQLVRPLGEHLRTWTGITHFFTYATRNFEIYGSLLFFSPWNMGFFRTIGVVLFIFMQLGFNLSMHLGLFGAIGIVTLLGLLPSYFWDVLVARVRLFFRRHALSGLVIYYDADCGFCLTMVTALKNVLLLSLATGIAPLRSDSKLRPLMDEHNSWIVIGRSGEPRFGFYGFTTVIRYSPIFGWLTPFLRLPIIRDIGEVIYRLVAHKRQLVCLPEKEIAESTRTQKATRYVLGGVLVFLSLYVLVWNLDVNAKTWLMQKTGWIGWTLRLDQQFGMFAPTPLTEDGWYVIPAVLKNGGTVDIFRNGPMLKKPGLFPVSYIKPKHVADGYPDQRWQKYLMNIAESSNASYRLGYGQYLCRTWNETHTDGETLMTFDMIFMIENTQPEGMPPTAPVRTVLWSHHCFDESAIPTPPNPPTSEPAI